MSNGSGGYSTIGVTCANSAATTCDDTGLTNGVTYYYVVEAAYSNGSLSSPSNQPPGVTFVGTSAAASPTKVVATAPATVSGPPASLTAKQSGSAIHLAWTGSTGATGYRVYRTMSNGSGGYTTTGATCANPAATTCDDTGLTNGVTYYYVVEAAYSNGTLSAPSNQPPGVTFSGTSVTPTPTPTSAPTPTPTPVATTTPTSSGIGHGNGPTITTFKASGPVTAQSGQTISGLSISNPNGPCITVHNVSNVTIVNNKIGPCGPTTAGLGIDAYSADHITVQNNSITDVASGMYAAATNVGGIVFSNNYVTRVRGPFPRGQMIQFDKVSGSGNRITCNVSDQALGGYKDSSGSYMGPEDHVNLYMTNGTSSSPVEVAYNKIRGGGSPSGGGLMTGDSGSSSYQYVHDNILVNPGQYGIAIAGGQNISFTSNRVYAAKNSWNNVGSYVWAQAGSACSNATFQSNRINYQDPSGNENGYWAGGGCGTVIGLSSNNFSDLTVTASIWDEVIPQCQ